MKIGSLFTGYGGLDMAVSQVTGGETVWVSDIDKGASKILAHRYPNVPNLGDITKIDWASVEPVDVLTGGFPCQDVSHAGKRAGMKPGTRSGLWEHMVYAIEQLKPRMVVIENVRGLLSAEAHSDMEPCQWCLGDRQPQSALRALGAVLGDLADHGYDARWCGLRAADVGACHGRFRVFVVATVRHARGEHGNEWRQSATGETSRWGPLSESAGRHRTPVTLLPTPTSRDWKASGDFTPIHEKHKLPHEIKLLPTPMAAEGTKPSNTMGVARREETGQAFLTNVIVTLTGLDPSDRTAPQVERFGDYTGAVEIWEQVTNREAPAPTAPLGRAGNQVLSPRFVEWMMGLPSGWITDVPGITRNEALKALGNGVVPQQAVAALEWAFTCVPEAYTPR